MPPVLLMGKNSTDNLTPVSLRTLPVIKSKDISCILKWSFLKLERNESDSNESKSDGSVCLKTVPSPSLLNLCALCKANNYQLIPLSCSLRI